MQKPIERAEEMRSWGLALLELAFLLRYPARRSPHRMSRARCLAGLTDALRALEAMSTAERLTASFGGFFEEAHIPNSRMRAVWKACGQGRFVSHSCFRAVRQDLLRLIRLGSNTRLVDERCRVALLTLLSRLIESAAPGTLRGVFFEEWETFARF
ncbi:MAG: hypothetical protein AAB460_02665 [Patescibacteria group bacterium]